MTIETIVNTHLAAWEGWNDLGYDARIAILRRWSERLPPASRAMVEYHCQQAVVQVARVHLMPGPTGETNELYCAGRGTFVVTAAPQIPAVAVIGQITAALVTGNTVLLCLPAGTEAAQANAVDADDIVAQLTLCGCSAISAIPDDALDVVLALPVVAGVAYAGEAPSLQELARQLAARDGGCLAAVIGETDVATLPVIGSPTYLLRFVTERTRTINITAVGGNATLLELGSGETSA
ncbi:proline dehydrogenase [Photobacterium japonica]|uniref:aldehyde dehydrogenase family protein n=1 Tax=Photobacterium japonica TaxID=2910235 RepID=UPI003D0D92AD